MLWKASVERHNEQRRLQARYAWHLHHVGQADRLRRTLEELISHHEEQAAKLLEAEEGVT
jgi:light-regulated signal transduction histidine kinase (bacteriophytochrome)